MADHDYRRVHVIDPITSDIHLFGQGAISGKPAAVAISPVNTDILVATQSPHLVLVFDDRGRYQRNISLAYKPYGLFVDRRGYIFITGNNAVQIYDSMWHKVQSLGQLGTCPSCFVNPRGITVNSQNEALLEMDHSNDRIQVFMKTTRAGFGGRGEGLNCRKQRRNSCGERGEFQMERKWKSENA